MSIRFLRHFGAKKKVARKAYGEFVTAGMKLGHREEFYLADEGRILGSEEFVDATIHRIGETKLSPRSRFAKQTGPNDRFDANRLIALVERACRVLRKTSMVQARVPVQCWQRDPHSDGSSTGSKL